MEYFLSTEVGPRYKKVSSNVGVALRLKLPITRFQKNIFQHFLHNYLLWHKDIPVPDLEKPLGKMLFWF